MNLETLILSKLTQEQKIKHCMFSFIGGCLTIKTHGHRGEQHTLGSVVGARGRTAGGWGGWGGIRRGEMPDIGDGGREETNHIAIHVQRSYMICTGTP